MIDKNGVYLHGASYERGFKRAVDQTTEMIEARNNEIQKLRQAVKDLTTSSEKLRQISAEATRLAVSRQRQATAALDCAETERQKRAELEQRVKVATGKLSADDREKLRTALFAIAEVFTSRHIGNIRLTED